MLRGMSDDRPPACASPDAIDRLVFAGLRKLSPGERLALAGRASAALERLCIAGLRLRHPHAGEEELRRRAGALRLGRELTVRVFGPQAEDWFQ
jgi:hypothetical protein